MNKNFGIVWLRDDFRVLKNPALSFASNNHDLVTVIYIFKKNNFENKREAQRWWLYKSLENFKQDLEKKKINLELITSNSYEKTLKNIANIKNISVYWNKVYEPKYINFDKKISRIFKEKNINFKIFKGNMLNEADEIKKNDKTPFKVFTPFWKTAELFYIDKVRSRSYTVKIKAKKFTLLKSKEKFENILPSKKWYNKFEKYWNPAESDALKIVKDFIGKKVSNYDVNRDVPFVNGTSCISPYLAFGQINVETIWEACNNIKVKNNGYRKYINELGWREFSHSLINYFPEMLEGNLRKEFDNFPWSDNKVHLNAWKKGQTGYPIVDAGMRELNQTGWMHNRVRMIVASFLVKHLRIHWKEGEKHFRNCLLDFNEANNIAGWQWVSGCGADAAPYFRIFNPILQGEKFDKEGHYVKKWVPELSEISKEHIHKPWENDKKLKNFELGKNYPMPIVNHKEAREAALAAFKKIKKNN